MPRRFILALALVPFATPALAHPGNHAGMSLIEIVQHYAEADHLAFLALTIIVGIAAYRHGRRTEAKAQSSARNRESDRR